MRAISQRAHYAADNATPSLARRFLFRACRCSPVIDMARQPPAEFAAALFRGQYYRSAIRLLLDGRDYLLLSEAPAAEDTYAAIESRRHIFYRLLSRDGRRARARLAMTSILRAKPAWECDGRYFFGCDAYGHALRPIPRRPRMRCWPPTRPRARPAISQELRCRRDAPAAPRHAGIWRRRCRCHERHITRGEMLLAEERRAVAAHGGCMARKARLFAPGRCSKRRFARGRR